MENLEKEAEVKAKKFVMEFVVSSSNQFIIRKKDRELLEKKIKELLIREKS